MRPTAWRASVGSLAAVGLLAACTGAGQTGPDAFAARLSELPVATATAAPPTTSPTSPAASPSAAAQPAEQALGAYAEYTEALSRALRRGDASLPGLRRVAAGQALRDARQRIRANRRDGYTVNGRLEPDAQRSDVRVFDGQATVTDCLINDLGWRGGGEAFPSNGDRRPVTATLVNREGRWLVSRVQGPSVRGPFASGDGCAPPELAEEILDGYEAFWAASYRASDPGGKRPADPSHPALTRTAVDPQLRDTRQGLKETRDRGQVIRSRIDSSAQVLGAFAQDRRAVVADCRKVVGRGGIFDAETGKPVRRDEVGDTFFVITDMRLDDGVWKVENYDIEADECTQPE